jgi:hypothetical protein
MDDDMESAVREELKRAARDQKAIRERLSFLLTRLPPSPREDAMLEGDEEYDFVTEVRTALECILADWIGSAIRDLNDLARYRANKAAAR